jgi:phage terminase large subunit
MMQRRGIYYYMLPTYNQAKKIIWDGMGKDGIKFREHFPSEVVQKIDETEMQITLTNGSIFQLVGTDKIDRIVGTNPVGCIFSEYSLQKREVWDLIEPILLENGGWASFIFTPRGKNHAFDLWQYATQQDHWFTSLLTIDDTKDEYGNPLFDPADIADIRRRGVDEEVIQQEYYCSFRGALQGAFYSTQMKKAEEEGRIGMFPYDPRYPVETWWDLGQDDAMAVGFLQQINSELRFIDYMEERHRGFPWFAGEMRARGYAYTDQHVAPHDIEVREYSELTRRETAAQHGIHFIVAPKLSLQEGIQAVREKFHRFTFHEPLAGRLIDCLRHYRRKYDEELQEYSKDPVRDQYTHGADMVRNGVMAFDDRGYSRFSRRALQEYSDSDFDPMNYEKHGQIIDTSSRILEVETDFDHFSRR